MDIASIKKNAYAMPLTNPAYPPGPYRFMDREYLIVSYRTDPAALAAVLPEPLLPLEPVVKYEFIKMPNSNGFGDYTESGQVIPVSFKGEEGVYIHSMYLDDESPIAGGREIWGFPKKFANPKVEHEGDVIVGKLHYGSVLCATMTMGFKHRALDPSGVIASLQKPNYLIKIIPHVDGSLRICELVRYYLKDINVKEAWSSPADLQLFNHVIADVAKLPVLEVLSAVHFVADITLGMGEVVHDYMKD
ncbi:acetoacetate decarboxylase [Polynucleobacter hirudinilacicola]|uniref:Acetoacetate decarboxylase n=1 Tax=Polynucleobacter hirudinilacicola TaxID=1743166 RepID=A0A210RZR5_9BURK|nr:acetoacetate decarboxylase [Polynucleobacter hirudinilacicola]OWF66488.1 acetoacetate decarboxylase [Polynucleobacter hirudinilacicola]